MDSRNGDGSARTSVCFANSNAILEAPRNTPMEQSAFSWPVGGHCPSFLPSFLPGSPSLLGSVDTILSGFVIMSLFIGVITMAMFQSCTFF